jgi:hypothetical protein
MYKDEMGRGCGTHGRRHAKRTYMGKISQKKNTWKA